MEQQLVFEVKDLDKIFILEPISSTPVGSSSPGHQTVLIKRILATTPAPQAVL
jgi:hypothetical protein